jgi:hypothetical protein
MSASISGFCHHVLTQTNECPLAIAAASWLYACPNAGILKLTALSPNSNTTMVFESALGTVPSTPRSTVELATTNGSDNDFATKCT